MIGIENAMLKRAAVESETSGRETIYKLLSKGLSCIPVVNDEFEVIGVVSEMDLLNALNIGKDADGFTAADVMTKDPKTVAMDTPMQEIVTLMTGNTYTMLPVVKDKKLAGLVTRQSVLEAWLEPEKYSRYSR